MIIRGTLLLSMLVLLPTLALGDPPPLTKNVRPKYKAGQIILKRNPAIFSALSKNIFSTYATETIQIYANIEGLSIVKLAPGISVEKAVRGFKADPSIEFAEPNYYYYLDEEPEPPKEEKPAEPVSPPEEPEPVKPVVGLDEKLGEQWFLHNSGQSIKGKDGKEDVDVNAKEAWESHTGSKDVVIMIIDTGVDHTHPDLKENMWVNVNEIAGNGIDDDENGYIDDIHGINAIKGSGDPKDDHGHGTHVAGTIAARGNNAVGVSGVMQTGSLIGCKFLSKWGGGTTSDAVKCLDYAAGLVKAGVNVIATNNSWGGGPFSTALFEAVKENMNNGILFIAAAGNEYSNNDSRSAYPANFSLPNVISVAAINNQGNKPFFSNHGVRTVHVAAPGVDIMSTVIEGKYQFMTGTSMATPVTTGVVGLTKSSQPDLDWRSLKNLVVSSGVETEVAKKNTISGRVVRLIDEEGVGALSCKDQIVAQRLSPKKNKLSIKVGDSVGLSMLGINCEAPYGEHYVDIKFTPVPPAPPEAPAEPPPEATEPVEDTPSYIFGDEVAEPEPTRIVLEDLGAAPDIFASDGIFSIEWVAGEAGTYELLFSNGDIVKATVS